MDPLQRSNPYRFFLVAAIGTYMGTLEGSIMNVALPTIAGELQCSIDVIAWVVLAYSLTLVSLMMAFGGWASRTGYGFAYKFGYSFFLAGTLICVFSHSLAWLLVGRVVQAVGSAMFQAIGMGLITTVFPAHQRGKAIGTMAVVVAAGLMTGPPLGGLMLDRWPWQSIFTASFLVGVLGLVYSLVVFRSGHVTAQQREIDLLGAASLSLSLLSGMLWLSLVDQYALTDIGMLALIVVCLASLAVFVRTESRSPTALIGLDLVKNRQFSIGILAMFLMFSALAGVTILVPFYLQDVLGLPPRQIGLFLMILPVTMAVFAPLAGRISDRVGYRLLTSSGLSLLLTGLYLLSRLEPATSTMYIVGSLTVVGCGVGVFNSPNSSAVMGAVDAARRTVASGAISTTRVIGMAVGVALSTALFSLYQSKYAGLGGESVAFVNSLHQVILMAMIPVAIGLLICLTRQNRLST